MMPFLFYLLSACFMRACHAGQLRKANNEEFMAQRNAGHKLTKGHRTDFASDATFESARMKCIARQMDKELQDARKTNRTIPDGRKPIVWLHLHNFGGTHICAEATRQGEKTPISNCDWPGDICSQQTGRVTCNERLNSGDYTFSMIERDISDDDLCEGVTLGTMLREPLSAMTSTLRANYYDKEALLEMLHTGVISAVRHSPCLPEWVTYQHFDNFATRSLSGSFLVPPLNMSREHLELAKKRLMKFDVVMILETLDSHVHQMSAAFQWDRELMDHSRRDNNHQSQAHSKEYSWTDEEAAFLKSINGLDYELYAFGAELAANRSQSFLRTSETPM